MNATKTARIMFATISWRVQWLSIVVALLSRICRGQVLLLLVGVVECGPDVMAFFFIQLPFLWWFCAGGLAARANLADPLP